MPVTEYLIMLNKSEILLLDLIRSGEELYRIKWPEMPDEHTWKNVLRLSLRHSIAPNIYKPGTQIALLISGVDYVSYKDS